MCLVIDSHILVINLNASESDVSYQRLMSLLGRYQIAYNNKIRSDWTNNEKYKHVMGWVEMKMLEPDCFRILPDDCKLDRVHKKKLRELGMTKKTGNGSSRDDIWYVEAASMTDLKYIISEDMHFYDPGAKDSSDKSKHKIRNERRGKLCKYLLKKLNIKVGMLQHAYIDLVDD